MVTDDWEKRRSGESRAVRQLRSGRQFFGEQAVRCAFVLLAVMARQTPLAAVAALGVTQIIAYG
ncbi:hypothetical protein, partial [Mesorhizobium retamae]